VSSASSVANANGKRRSRRQREALFM
jgi:hypothetical protein